MKKSEIIEELSKRSNISKSSARRIIKNLQDIIIEAIKDQKVVNLTGFASFKPVKRKEKTMINPKTGEKIVLPSTDSVKISPLKRFKDTINEKTRN